MDDPGLEERLHGRALRGLERINRISVVARTMEHTIRQALEEPFPRPLRVLDLATGGGDVPIALAPSCARSRGS